MSDPIATADYIAARASESLSYGDLAYAESQGWCSSSPDGMGPHIPDDTTDPLTCAECGATIDDIEATPTCDICGEADPEGGADWNGETGNHHSCEADAARKAGKA